MTWHVRPVFVQEFISQSFGSLCGRASVAIGQSNGSPGVRRTYETDGGELRDAEDLTEWVNDKRKGWRANRATSRRRQRRYQEKMVRQLLRQTAGGTPPDEGS